MYSPSAHTNEQLKKYKSLEAYKFYQDGWIRQILHKKIYASEGNYCTLRCVGIVSIRAIQMPTQASLCYVVPGCVYIKWLCHVCYVSVTMSLCGLLCSVTIT